MAYLATVFQVMIASPSDVAQERQLVEVVIREWNSVNSLNRSVVLMPASWETHAAPLMGERPQEVINRQVLEQCDLLIGVFWTRIGTPTGESASGTVEEIEKHTSVGKPAMLYFSTAPAHLESVDTKQYQELRKFRDQCQANGLIETYDSLSEFREKLTRQLAITVNQDEYLKKHILHNDELMPSDHPTASAPILASRPRIPDLSEEARELLSQASQSPQGIVMRVRAGSGLMIETNDKGFVEQGNPRSEAAWEAALSQLDSYGLLQDQGYKREVFRVTHEGYRVADMLKALPPNEHSAA